MPASVMYHEGNRQLQDRFDSRRISDRLEEKLTHKEFAPEDRLFIEGVPAVLLGIVTLFVLDDGPAHARWLSSADRERVLAVVCVQRARQEDQEEEQLGAAGPEASPGDAVVGCETEHDATSRSRRCTSWSSRSRTRNISLTAINSEARQTANTAN